MSTSADRVGGRLNRLLTAAGQEPLSEKLAQRFEDYLSLILRWNAHFNLTAIRDEEGILSRHFVESIVCARALPVGIATLLDYGSGAGFPGVPIALCRPEIAVTLAESQSKKAAFLNEAIRFLALSAVTGANGTGTKVYSGRAHSLSLTFDCVTMRAVDRMERAIEAAARLVRPGGWLVPMTTRYDIGKLQAAAGPQFSWQSLVSLPGSDGRLLALGLCVC
jgi:16S rRNA (guanine527-N7)-methyltransferase